MSEFNSSQHLKLWYGIRVRPKFERVVSAALNGKGYEEFLPFYTSKRKWSDRSKSLEMPLFPGYVFCRFDVNDRLLPILTTPGVLSIVGLGRTPVPIPDCEIEAVKRVIRMGFPLEPWQKLLVGTKVLIEKGPLTGIEGVVLEIRNQHRLIISIPLLQRAVAVGINDDMLCPLPDGSWADRRLAVAASQTKQQSGVAHGLAERPALKAEGIDQRRL